MSTEPAAGQGALVAGVLLLRDRLVLGHSFKILEVGTLALFAALALYTRATGHAWTTPAVRLVVVAGLLLYQVPWRLTLGWFSARGVRDSG